MCEAFLLMGGNIGDRKANLSSALALIGARCGRVSLLSSLYETQAWGLQDQDPFLNQAVRVHTYLSPSDLLCSLLSIEESLGRVRDVPFGPRTIDLDILLYDDQVIDEPQLQIPHPQLPFRRFALQPLCQIAPNLVHPILNITVEEMLRKCSDPLQVHKIL